jgi:hypothetical protein
VREHDGLLCVVLTLAILVTGSASRTIRTKEDDLSYAFVSVDASWQRCRVADLDSDLAAPLRFERSDVHDETAASVGTLTDADCQHVPRDHQMFNRGGQDEAVGRDDASVARVIHERTGAEVFGINDSVHHVGEDFEITIDANIVAVASHPVRDDAFAHLFFDERNDLDLVFNLVIR